jgi:hypothetical protein
LVVVTVALLSVGWALTLRGRARWFRSAGIAADDACGCELPTANRAGERLLVVTTALVAIALAFPYLTPFLF